MESVSGKIEKFILPAPAKINLTLEVLGRRPDGFHEIRSVAQTVNLCDTLTFRPGRGIEFRCRDTGFAIEKSLMPRAASLLLQTAGSEAGASIAVAKTIPLTAGLGGDSSSAAAVLYGLNRLWKLGYSLEKLAGLGAKLGSDIPLFFRGGTVLLEGRGERVSRLTPLPGSWVLIAMPALPPMRDKTRSLYAGLTPAHYTDGGITSRFIDSLKNGDCDPAPLFNTFESVAFELFPGLRAFREHLLKLGAPHVHLAGSGPAVFTLLADAAQANDLYALYRQQNIEAYLAETLPAADIESSWGFTSEGA